MNDKAVKEIHKEVNKRVKEKYRTLGNDTIKLWMVRLICEVFWDRLEERLKEKKVAD